MDDVIFEQGENGDEVAILKNYDGSTTRMRVAFRLPDDYFENGGEGDDVVFSPYFTVYGYDFGGEPDYFIAEDFEVCDKVFEGLTADDCDYADIVGPCKLRARDVAGYAFLEGDDHSLCFIVSNQAAITCNYLDDVIAFGDFDHIDSKRFDN